MSWQFLFEHEQRSRRERICTLCGHRIRRGAKYVYRSGVRDGQLIQMRMHAVCESLTRDWDDVDWQTGEKGNFCTFDLNLPLLPSFSAPPRLRAKPFSEFQPEVNP